jgi:hypothetical protein
MSKTNKLFHILLVVITALMFVFSSCAPREKIFERGGMRIYATSQFKEIEVSGQTISLDGKDKFITALVEYPNSSFSINHTAREYAQLCVTYNKLPSNTVVHDYLDEDSILSYSYFIYTKNVEGNSYTYLAITKKSNSAFYLIQFACETDKYPKYEKLFYSWAAKVEVGIPL